MSEDKSTLIIRLTGDHSTLDFLRSRCHGTVSDLVAEWCDEHPEDEVVVDWEWET